MNKIERLKSLIWLRWQYLLSHFALLYLCVIMPFGTFFLFWMIPKFHANVFVLSMSLIFLYSLTAGVFISMVIGEEKEKKNFRTLLLSGVKLQEYILSIVIVPFFCAFFVCLSFPLFLGVVIPSWFLYLVISVSTCLTFILVNLTIGLLCQSQTQASFLIFIIYLISIFSPFLSDNQLLRQVIDCLFFGAHIEYFIKLKAFKLTDPTLSVMFLWLGGSFVLALYAFMKNKKERKQ